MLELRIPDYFNVNALAIPFGVLAFLPFVPLFWILPTRWVRGALILTSSAFMILTCPWQFCVTFAASVVYGWAVIYICLLWVRREASADANPNDSRTQPVKQRVAFVWAAVHAVYLPALIWPNFPWLPVESITQEREYYWIAWLGLAYLVIRVLHVALDVAQRKIERISLIDYLAFALFPTCLRMGPIARFQELQPQFLIWRQNLKPRRILAGLGRVFLGLVRLGIMFFVLKPWIVGGVWERPQDFGTLTVLITVALSPYFVFLWISGYIDMAIGLGRMMGFDLPENFNWPYISRNIREFWRRWHITLGSFLFEYIYIPLGGSRRQVLRNYLVTFVYCAIWHGFIWSIVAFCLLQAVGMTINRWWAQYWNAQREAATPLYQTLLRWRIAGGRFAYGSGIAMNMIYHTFCAGIFVDERYVGTRWIPYLLGLGS